MWGIGDGMTIEEICKGHEKPIVANWCGYCRIGEDNKQCFFYEPMTKEEQERLNQLRSVSSECGGREDYFD